MRVPRRLAGIGATDLANATAFDTYVGPAREVTVDQNRKIVALHDGVTAGGVRVLMSTQLGAVNGVASLDNSGQVPVGQLGPALLDTQLGAASGVASLDGTGYVPAAQLGNALKKGGDSTTGRYVFQRATGTGTAPSPDFEQDVSESFTAGTGFYISHAILATRTGGTGHREALHVEQLSSAASAGEFVVGIQGQGRITAGSGSAFGLNGYVWVDTAAASTVEASAGEFNTDIRRGVTRKVGLQVVDVSTSTGSGSAYDTGIMITKQAGGVGYSCGIQFGDTAQFPVFTGGQIIAATGTIPTLASGINFAAVTTTIASFVAKAGGNGLAFGGDFGGGLIRSSVTAGAGIMTFQASYTEFSQPVAATGYKSRSGTSGAYAANYINFFWNTATSKVDLYVDTNRIGSITTGA
ncbi:hypothetical protein [Rhizobium rhizogenes]|uniref:hypothetical protein n=1 Tax=Rhizobium rhizogenes TaxID=359 RepID=UPI001573F6D5|nr:hypothetical protein [Rhizobium rhizogenes]NTG94260.1 hypothetical protein [Rhizobium rhizogenes]